MPNKPRHRPAEAPAPEKKKAPTSWSISRDGQLVNIRINDQNIRVPLAKVIKAMGVRLDNRPVSTERIAF